MDIIVFGVGKIAREILPFLESKYHILFFVDNNEKKFNDRFEKYFIRPPEEIKKYYCNIVIASTRYRFEIVNQLKHIGISQDRIYLCRCFYIEKMCEYEIFPLLEEKIVDTFTPLVQYDLNGIEEKKVDNKKKILIFCSFYSVYFKQLIENISERYEDVEFSLLTNAKESRQKVVSEKLKHIYYYQTMKDLKAILKQLPIYDVMQLLWIETEWAYFYQYIRVKTKRLNLNVGGSDFYCAVAAERDYKNNLISCSDKITAETLDTIQNFISYYGENVSNKVSLLPFGIEVLDFIKNSKDISKNVIKEKYHMPRNKIVVTCGHNARDSHQHIGIIKAVNQLPTKIKEQVVCVIPMTYPQGCDEYISSVKRILEETDLEYVILTDFMDFQAMAEYALISDIMIHVQVADQLSSTMLEEMYTGSIVIAGSWLPYQSLHDMGIFFLDVDKVTDVTLSLENVVTNIKEYKKKCVGNKEIVWKHSSWDELAPRWHALWE